MAIECHYASLEVFFSSRGLKGQCFKLQEPEMAKKERIFGLTGQLLGYIKHFQTILKVVMAIGCHIVYMRSIKSQNGPKVAMIYTVIAYNDQQIVL